MSEKTRQIAMDALRMAAQCNPEGPAFVAFQLIADLCARVEALESREEVRQRIKPIQEGRKPEPGMGE